MASRGVTNSSILARLSCVLVCLTLPIMDAAALIMVQVQEGLYAHLDSKSMSNGMTLDLGCHVPDGKDAGNFFRTILSDSAEAQKYSAARNVVVPFDKLEPEYKRATLLAVFEHDYVDEQGWHHTVLYAEPELQETLWSLCEWLTGNGLNWHLVQDVNNRQRTRLERGETILIPSSVLLPALRRPTERQPTSGETIAEEETRSFTTHELMYGNDAKGEYAAYRLKEGEALYTDVIVQFTDYTQHTDVMVAAKKITDRSAITDVRRIKPGTRILIPMDILSDRFKPATSAARRQFDESVAASERVREELKKEGVGKDLEGVVVVLDPGHGSADPGRKSVSDGLYEDEIAYDIMCRIMKILKEETQARVYPTMVDPSEGYAITDATRFAHDEDEILLTTPPFPDSPTSSKVLLNLRYYLANDIFDREMERGTEPDKVIFTSLHVDSLHASLRGAMIYIPGADQRGRRPVTNHTNRPYNQIEEVRRFASTASSRQQDETISRAFAQTLYEELGKKRVQRHKHSPAIRNIIIQGGGVKYVPAVLQHNKIPTKVLLETANMANATDRQRLANPEWRQLVAEGYVNALRAHYGTESPSMVAAAD